MWISGSLQWTPEILSLTYPNLFCHLIGYMMVGRDDRENPTHGRAPKLWDESWSSRKRKEAIDPKTPYINVRVFGHVTFLYFLWVYINIFHNNKIPKTNHLLIPHKIDSKIVGWWVLLFHLHIIFLLIFIYFFH